MTWVSARTIQVPIGQRFEVGSRERVSSIVPGWNGMLIVGIESEREPPEDVSETAEARVTGEGS